MGGGLDNTGTNGDTGPVTPRQNSLNANDVYQRTDQPWRASYGSVAPAFTQNQGSMGYDQTQTAPPTSGSNQPWRAGYNNVAPAYNQGDQVNNGGNSNTPWRPGYNNVAPGANGGTEVQDPNRNGNQPSGPSWHPTVTSTWGSPGPAQGQPGRPGDVTQPGGGPAQTGNPKDNLYDPHRPDLDQGMQKQAGFPGQMLIGGLSGVAFGGPVPWILNRTADSILLSPEAKAGMVRPPLVPTTGLAGKILPEGAIDKINGAADTVTGIRDAATPKEGSLLYKGAQTWRDNFDSRYFNSGKLVLQQTNYAQFDSQVENIITQNHQRIADLNAKFASPTIPVDEATAARLELQKLEARQEWLNTPEWKGAASGASQLEKLKGEMITRPDLFTAEELKLLNDRQAARASIADLSKQESGQKFFGNNPGANFVKGAAFVGLTMVADHYLDKIFTGHDHQDALTNSSWTEPIPLVGGLTKSWGTNALLVPMAFTTGGWDAKGLAVKAAYTGGALIAGKVLDKMLPASDHWQYSQYLRPNGLDSVLMGAAFLLPAANNKLRLGMIGGAWVAGRVFNMFEGPSKGDVKNEGFDKMKSDMHDRTSGSMNSAIDTFKNLGEQDNYALRLYTSDWLRPGRQYDGMLSAYRGAVILTDAFGESRLDKGTLLPKSQKDFILGGQHIDIGGQATRALLIAQVNLDRAKQQTQNEMGKDEKGNKVSQSELAGLDEVGKRINSTLQDKIYGKHDIPGVVNEITSFFKGNQEDTLLMKFDIDNSLALNRGNKNTQFVAKLFRDMACLELGMANGEMGDPQQAAQILYGTQEGRQTEYNNGQARGYDGAMDAIALAKQLDPNNADIPQLEAEAARLAQQIPGKVQSQLSNPNYNPLNVNDGLAKK